MLTYWIPEGHSMLPSNASHQVGVGGFVINDKKEVSLLLVVMQSKKNEEMKPLERSRTKIENVNH